MAVKKSIDQGGRHQGQKGIKAVPSGLRCENEARQGIRGKKRNKFLSEKMENSDVLQYMKDHAGK